MIKRLLFLLGLLLSIKLISYAQLTENFDDGDYTNNIVWTGNPADWIVNSSLQLQSNNVSTGGLFYLSTANTLSISSVWEFYIMLGFNPSSANYVDVYLTASDNDLTLPANAGYFVRIGNTNDEVSLYRKDAGSVITKIIDGADGILNKSQNVLKVKISRDAAGTWTLSRDITGSGNFYASEGYAVDTRYTTSAFFGIFVKQSTAGFFQKHFIDDITITPYVPDRTPPVILSATGTSINTSDILFSEPLDISTAETPGNYIADNGLGSPVTAVKDASNSALVHLTFINSFPPNTMLSVTVNGVKDIAGNALLNVTATFSYYVTQQFDVVIDEIFADPSPVVGLPGSEFIELRNLSAFPVNLSGWKLSDGTSLAALPGFILKPDSLIIICTASAAPAYASFGTVYGVSNFPSLDNDEGVLALLSPENKVIHTISYSILWYQNELKKLGGWTLEMIDTKNPCSGSANWKASIDTKGGTPGKKNSVDNINPDQDPPKLLRAFATDSNSVSLIFDEPLDSTKASSITNYNISDAIGTPLTATAVSPVFNKVNLHLASPLLHGKVYTVTTTGTADCTGNVIGSNNSARTGLTAVADSLDVVINEILFNPPADGVDYIEIYNRSISIIDLRQLSIATRSSTGVISSVQQISNESNLIFPGDVMVITEDPLIVKQRYITTDPNAFIGVKGMPSFPDDMGDVIILNLQGEIVDEVRYSDKWHFQLITNTEGVSLERIDYEAPSLQNNFHSAATSAGYGTPGYKNSQFRVDQQVQGELTIQPEIFSPDNDGIDDFATINYNFSAPGYVANITIFDASGRPVRYLQRNALCGSKGSYRWDGLDEKLQKLSQGIYIFFTEIFNTAGKRKQFKNTIVLARRK